MNFQLTNYVTGIHGAGLLSTLNFNTSNVKLRSPYILKFSIVSPKLQLHFRTNDLMAVFLRT